MLRSQHYGGKEDSGVWNTSNRKQELPPNWYHLRSQVLRRDEYRCQIRDPGCRGAANEVDHIQRGSNHALENLRAVCPRCHARKSSAEGNARRAELRSRRYRTERHPGRL